MPARYEKPPVTTDQLDRIQPQSLNYLKAVLLLAFVAMGVIAYLQLRHILTFQYLASRETTLRQLQLDQPWLVATVAVGVYLAVAGLSLPGAAVLTLTCGWYFGFWRGLVVVSFGSTAGATLAFLLSRYFLRDWVQNKMVTQLKPINEAFEREGAFYLFSLRLLPAVPFFVINAVMGLTKIKARTFWWVSQLGMLPGTAAYVYAGATVPSLQSLADNGLGGVISWQLLLALVGLGVLPIITKRLVGFFANHPCTTTDGDVGDGSYKTNRIDKMDGNQSR